MKKNKRLYAFLDIDHPMVAWEVAIGRIKSANYNENNSFGLSIWQYNLLSSYIKHGADNKIINEFKLEKVRFGKFPNSVSRLKGMYFFEEKNDAEKALKRWGINIPSNYISEIEFYPVKYTKVDSEWITFNILNNNDERWMENYWKGLPYGSEPLYEVLVEGIGIVLNYDLRIKAYQTILNLWPYSTNLLAMAVCTFQIKNIDNIASIKPGIITDHNKILGGFYIDISHLDDNQKEIIESVKFCRDNNSYPKVINPKDINIFFNLPDMREYAFENKKENVLFEVKTVLAMHNKNQKHA